MARCGRFKFELLSSVPRSYRSAGPLSWTQRSSGIDDGLIESLSLVVMARRVSLTHCSVRWEVLVVCWVDGPTFNDAGLAVCCVS
jgi:hypothetical protein